MAFMPTKSTGAKYNSGVTFEFVVVVFDSSFLARARFRRPRRCCAVRVERVAGCCVTNEFRNLIIVHVRIVFCFVNEILDDFSGTARRPKTFDRNRVFVFRRRALLVRGIRFRSVANNRRYSAFSCCVTMFSGTDVCSGRSLCLPPNILRAS